MNNVHVSRCLFYVSHLLENIEESKPSKHKQYELDFQLTPEDAAKVTITDKTGKGQYLAVSYDANAQLFILENLFKL